MKTKFEKLECLHRYKILAVARGSTKDSLRLQAESCIEAGCHIIELSMAVPGTPELLSELKQKYEKDILIGAGTVHDVFSCRTALLAGADFIASPEFDIDICRICNLYCSIYFAGCFTAAEIRNALLAGTDIIKLFPASSLDMASFSSLCAFFPGMAVMPAGGVSSENAKEFFDRGATLLGRPFGSTKEEILKSYPSFLKSAGIIR